MILPGFITPVSAQPFSLEGKVIDAANQRPLAFVNIAVKGTRYGCTSDIDGHFILKTPDRPSVISLSYIGYESAEYKVEDPERYMVIPMKSKPVNLGEVMVYPGVNPANRIINLVIENRKINNPEKMESFSYDSYNKFFATAYTSGQGKPDLSITDTVAFESLAADTANSARQPDITTPVFRPDSAMIVSFLHDTAIVHPLLRNMLSDSSDRLKVKMAVQFIKDNPWLLKENGILSDTTQSWQSFFPGLPAPGNDTVSLEPWLQFADTLLKDPGVLAFLVPAIDSVLSDTAMSAKLFGKTALEEIMAGRQDTVKQDSGEDDFSLDKQDLFLMESITHREFLRPDLSKETVVATRTSGLQDPVFVLLATQIQSFSFYNEVIRIMNKNYINPVSKGSTSKYFFHIEDTIFNEGSTDTVFIISFQPKRNTRFDGLKGLLYINSNKWAIQNVIAGSARKELVDIKIQQQYDFLDGRQWFPEQLNTELTLNQESIITMDGDSNSYLPIGIGRTYIKNVILNPELRKRQFDAVAVEVDRQATKRDSVFWNQYRAVALTQKDRETYRFMDSLGREYHFDRYARNFFTWKSGYLPVKFININLSDLLLYNRYEGLRSELDLTTNQNFSRFISLAGYFAYGTGDRSLKYGGSTSIQFRSDFEPWVKFSYGHDIAAYGIGKITTDMTWFSDQYLRRFMVTEMTPVETFDAAFGFRAFRYQKWQLSLQRFGYGRLSPFETAPAGVDGGSSSKVFTEASIGVRFAYKEKLVKTMQQELLQSLNHEPVRTRYPVIWLTYTRGLRDVLNGGYSYNRLDARMEKSFFIKYLGTSSVILEGGIIGHDLPYTRLYNAPSSYRPFTIEAPNSFGTMRMNEFVSDRYVYLFFNHNFGKLLIRTDHFQPEIHLITNAGFGDRSTLAAAERPGWEKTMNQGYYESGIMIRNLVNLKLVKFGLGVYYRYGPYAFSSPKDNFAFKFSIGGPF